MQNSHEQKRHQCRMGRAFGSGAAMGRRSAGQVAEGHEHRHGHCGQGQCQDPGQDRGQGKGRCCRHGLARKAGNGHCTGHGHGQSEQASCSCTAGQGDAASTPEAPEAAGCTA